MSQQIPTQQSSRRHFLQQTGAAAGGVALASSLSPRAYAAEDNTIRLAIIGCGGRGTGAIDNALKTKDQGPIKLYAAADLNQGKIDRTLKLITRRHEDQVDVPKERQFTGFDAYKKAIDALRPGDVAMCTTRAYIRPVHVEYAVQKGINVFMEKPFSPDPKGLKRMLAAANNADNTGSKIAAGLQCRHSPARYALIDKINSGEMGDLQYIRADRLTGRGWMGDVGDRANDLMNQLNFGKIHLYWVGSGHMVDNLIHQIDECCWLMDDWPVECHGMGGREVNSHDHGQNNDIYSMEFTFPNGKKAFCGFRRALKGRRDFATYVHCSKRAGQFSGNVHKATVHMFKDHRIDNDHVVWSPEDDKHSPWDYEWIDFVDAIRNDKPYNEGVRAVYADYASLMGRAAAHLNRIVTWDEVTNSDFQFCDYLDDLSEDSPPPVKADENGFFPAPEAGEWTEL
jgi:predicted dehydrogenase